MAGGAQGGGGRPAQPGPQGQPAPTGQPQINPQAFMQYQNALQNYRQGAMGMPSQVPGANMAAPGGGAINMLPAVAGPAPMPQQPPPIPQTLSMAPPQDQPIPQTLSMTQQAPQVLPMAPQGPQGLPIAPPQGQPAPSPMRPGMLRGRGPMPQIQGNPNAMPVQRPMRGHGRGRYG